jgi:L-arabinose isomerase
MLEVCPSIASGQARIEVHPLGIGGKDAPARLVFEGRAGDAIVMSLIDMGGRLRLIVQDVECVQPIFAMPNLPVARVMWRPKAGLVEGIRQWILVGGAHHTVLTYAAGAQMFKDWADIMGVEVVHLTAETRAEELKDRLELADMLWKLRDI